MSECFVGQTHAPDVLQVARRLGQQAHNFTESPIVADHARVVVPEHSTPQNIPQKCQRIVLFTSSVMYDATCVSGQYGEHTGPSEDFDGMYLDCCQQIG